MPVKQRKSVCATRLKSALLQDIEAGKYERGGFLPAETCLAERYNVSRRTVRKVLDVLFQDRQLEKIPYRGAKLPHISGGAVNEAGQDDAIGQIAFITAAQSSEADEYIRGISGVLDHDRFALAAYPTFANLGRYRQIVQNVMRTRPAGVILSVVSPSVLPLDGAELARWGIPIVTIGRLTVPGLVCDRVEESGGVVALACRRILKKGYRDIAYLAPDLGGEHLSMVEAIRNRLAETGLTIPEEKVLTYPAPHGYGEAADPYVDAKNFLIERFRKGFRCELLIANHDYPAVAAIQACAEVGIRVPEQMKIISLMHCNVRNVCSVPLTSIDAMRGEQARTAMQLLVGRIDGYKGPIEVCRTPVELIEGETA